MPSFTDQLNRTIHLPGIPRSIVSLVPSQTELLFDLGLDTEVTGITKFCVHPEQWFRQKQRIGGTKNVHTDIIHQLQPDLIIANKEENVQEQVEALAEQYSVWISDVNTLEDAYAMIHSIGLLTGTSEKAAAIATEIQQGFEHLPTAAAPLRTGYLIWKDPYMTIGNNTFIHHLLHRIGLHNVFGEQTRYPAISIEALQQANCQLLLLSSEPYPFQQKHIDDLQQYLPGTRIMLTDGEMFSWYGSHLLKAPAYFQSLLHSLHFV